MLIRYFTSAVVTAVLAGCMSVDFDQIGTKQAGSIDVSPYQLLAAPERYDGRLVNVIGVASFDFAFEGVSLLYPTKDDYRHRTDSYIWLYTFSKELSTKPKLLSKLDGRFIRLSGVFHAQAVPDPTPQDQIGCLWPECNGGGRISGISFAERVE